MESCGPETNSMCYLIFTQNVILEMPQNEPTFKIPTTETQKRQASSNRGVLIELSSRCINETFIERSYREVPQKSVTT